MELEMANELKDFLAALDPVWEDVHEFDWLKSEDIVMREERINLLELNRFPGLKILLEAKQYNF
jgi:hypothetical protein